MAPAAAGRLRLIGLDPGLRRTGWGVIDSVGSRLVLVACGIVESDAGDTMAARLATLFRGIDAVLETHAPDEAAVEETFVNRNPTSTLKLGQARGVALAAASLRGIPVGEYAPNAVKKAVVGSGHADKAQIQHMIARLLPGASALAADAADALAVAICHLHHTGMARLTRRAAGAAALGAMP